MAHSEEQGNGGGTMGRWAFVGFALVAGYFLYTEHRAHLFSALPYLLLAACPLMHLFHHGGHGHGHGHHGTHPGEGPADPASPGDQDAKPDEPFRTDR